MTVQKVLALISAGAIIAEIFPVATGKITVASGILFAAMLIAINAAVHIAEKKKQ